MNVLEIWTRNVLNKFRVNEDEVRAWQDEVKEFIAEVNAFCEEKGI